MDATDDSAEEPSDGSAEEPSDGSDGEPDGGADETTDDDVSDDVSDEGGARTQPTRAEMESVGGFCAAMFREER